MRAPHPNYNCLYRKLLQKALGTNSNYALSKTEHIAERWTKTAHILFYTLFRTQCNKSSALYLPGSANKAELVFPFSSKISCVLKCSTP